MTTNIHDGIVSAVDTSAPQDVVPPSRLILILSPERSGSTLLSMMLGGHPRIVAPPEMHLLAYDTLDDWLSDYPSALNSLLFALNALGLPCSEDHVRREFRGWLTKRVYEPLLAQCADRSQLLIDKTPRDARDQATLRRAETLRPFYIWLLRHPLGVAASRISYRQVERRKLSQAHWLYRAKHPLYRLRERILRNGEVRRQVNYWADLHTRIAAFLAAVPPSRQATVHYELLVREPRRVMTELSGAFGLTFAEGMLHPRENLPSVLESTLGDWKIKERRSIDSSAADSWRKTYDEGLLDARIRQLMDRFGVTSAGASSA